MKADVKELFAEADEICGNINCEEVTPEYMVLAGQEKYEADREKCEAEKIVENKRQTAKQAEEAATQMAETVKHFRRMAAASRETAERVRKPIRDVPPRRIF